MCANCFDIRHHKQLQSWLGRSLISKVPGIRCRKGTYECSSSGCALGRLNTGGTDSSHTWFRLTQPVRTRYSLPVFTLSFSFSQIWQFSSLFSKIKSWEFNEVTSMSEHLKTFPFNIVGHKTDPIRLTSMCQPQEQTRESLVSTFRARPRGRHS